MKKNYLRETDARTKEALSILAGELKHQIKMFEISFNSKRPYLMQDDFFEADENQQKMKKKMTALSNELASFINSLED